MVRPCRKYIKALLIGALAAVAAGLPCVIALAVLELYLSGHGMTWHRAEFNEGFIDMTVLDLVLVAAMGGAFVTVATLTIKDKI